MINPSGTMVVLVPPGFDSGTDGFMQKRPGIDHNSSYIITCSKYLQCDEISRDEIDRDFK